MSVQCLKCWCVLVLFVVLVHTSPFLPLEPIRCAPCAPGKMQNCAPLPPDCTEAQREPACGCCLTCALRRGEPCGVYTAHCGTGLRCTPNPDDLTPIHSLIRGQAVCSEYSEPQNPQNPAGDAEINAELGMDHSLVLDLLGQSKFSDAQDAQETMKARINAILNKLVQHGPCHTELHQALDKIATSQSKLGEKFTIFYLPNCDKHGFYKAKQCETSLEGQDARCWCVSSWNGKQIPGTKDLLGDLDCQQELSY